MPKKIKTQVPRMAARFVRAPGADITDEQAAIVGPELLKIALENKVDDVLMLDKKLVYSYLQKNPDHILWTAGNYERDPHKAAEKHWLDHTGKLLRSIRYERFEGKVRVLEPVWIVANVPPGKVHQQPRRGHVLRQDVLSKDPIFVSALGAMIRQARHVVGQLEGLTASRETPGNLLQLVRGLREVLMTYEASLLDHAAE